jgi:hypothetical protein
MTAGLHTVNLANKILDAMRDGGVALSPPTDLFVKLHTGDPGVNGTANAAVGDATRKALTQAAPSGGSMAISGTFPLWTNGGTSETITHISVHDSATAGECKYTGALGTSQPWVNGNTLTLNVLNISMAPLAA